MGASGYTFGIHRRIAVVFDFDDTLAPDSTSGFVKTPKRVKRRTAEGWDSIPDQTWTLIEKSAGRNEHDWITLQRFQNFGRQLQLFEGVTDAFGRLKDPAGQANDAVELRFVLLSCGIADVIRANEFLYADSGEIHFPKMIVSHTAKTKFLRNIASGAATDGDEIPHGFTDVPSFELLERENSIAFGLYKEGSRKRWGEQVDSNWTTCVMSLPVRTAARIPSW